MGSPVPANRLAETLKMQAADRRVFDVMYSSGDFDGTLQPGRCRLDFSGLIGQIKKSTRELFPKGVRTMGITEIIPTLISNMVKEATLSNVIGVGFIFTYLAVLIVIALIRIKQGKHMHH